MTPKMTPKMAKYTIDDSRYLRKIFKVVIPASGRLQEVRKEEATQAMSDYIDNELPHNCYLNDLVLNFIVENDLLECLKMYMELECWGYIYSDFTLPVEELRRMIRSLKVRQRPNIRIFLTSFKKTKK